jgi:NDP-sugar pyrophosphorylase family protein
MILAAGYGTRLGEVGRVRPKPMLPVMGRPLVRWGVDWLVHHGIRDVVVNLHHLGEQIETELGDGSRAGARVVYSHEAGLILGTGGGLRQARPHLDRGDGVPIVIANGKIVHDVDLAAVLAHHARSGAEATMVLRPDREGTWGSPILLDDAGFVRSLAGATRGAATTAATTTPYMFTGIHVLSPALLDRIPAAGEQCVIRTGYVPAMHEGRVAAYVHEGYWWEHSTPERYLQGVFNLLRGDVSLPWASSPQVGIDPTAIVAPTAEILAPVRLGAGVRVGAGARVGPYVQVDDGASIMPGSVVERAIVWSNAVVDGELRDVVVSGR